MLPVLSPVEIVESVMSKFTWLISVIALLLAGCEQMPFVDEGLAPNSALVDRAASHCAKSPVERPVALKELNDGMGPDILVGVACKGDMVPGGAIPWMRGEPVRGAKSMLWAD